MTSEEIADLCRNARPQLGPHPSYKATLNENAVAVQRVNRRDVSAPPGVVGAVEAGLASHPVIGRNGLKGFRTTSSPQQTASFSLRHAALWLLAQTRHGDPYHALNQLISLLDENEVECLEVTAIWGLFPDVEIDLGEGIHLVTLDSLPGSPAKDELLGVQRVLGPGKDIIRMVPRPRAALIRRSRYGPVFPPLSEDDEFTGGPVFQERMAEMALALVLFSEHGVAPIAHWFQLPDEPPGLDAGGFGGTQMLHWPFHQHIELAHYDAEDMRSVVASYLRLVPEREYLRMALTWLNRAMYEPEARERALELGIALECLLLKHDEDSKTERIAQRGSLALGTPEAHERLRALYGLRSKVAHSGILPDHAKWDGKPEAVVTILEEGTRMCRDLIRIELRTDKKLKEGSYVEKRRPRRRSGK